MFQRSDRLPPARFHNPIPANIRRPLLSIPAQRSAQRHRSTLPPTDMYPPPRPAHVHTSITQQYSINDAAVRLHIINLVKDKLPRAHPDNVALLVMHITSSLVRMMRIGELGPHGIRSTDEIFLGVGYEGCDCYMGLLVNAPGAGAVRAFFKGDTMERSKKNEMQHDVAMRELELRFVSALTRRYDQIRDYKLAQGRW